MIMLYHLIQEKKKKKKMIRIQPKNSYLPNLLEIRIPNLLVAVGEETKREEQRGLGRVKVEKE
jgi:hypothetical protein